MSEIKSKLENTEIDKLVLTKLLQSSNKVAPIKKRWHFGKFCPQCGLKLKGFTNIYINPGIFFILKINSYLCKDGECSYIYCYSENASPSPLSSFCL